MREGEPKIPESEIEEKQEQIPEEKEQEYSLSPEDREQVMRKFEELINSKKDELIIRFVSETEFEDCLNENNIQGEVAGTDSFRSFLVRIREYSRNIGNFWSEFALEKTDWVSSIQYSSQVEHIILYKVQSYHEKFKNICWNLGLGLWTLVKNILP